MITQSIYFPPLLAFSFLEKRLNSRPFSKVLNSKICSNAHVCDQSDIKISWQRFEKKKLKHDTIISENLLRMSCIW